MALQSIIAGRAYVLGDNIDTDQIIPAQYLTFNPAIPEEYRQFGKYALSSVPPSRVRPPPRSAEAIRSGGPIVRILGLSVPSANRSMDRG